MTCFFHNLNHGQCSGPAVSGYCALHREQSFFRARWDTVDHKPRSEFRSLAIPANQGQALKGRAA